MVNQTGDGNMNEASDSDAICRPSLRISSSTHPIPHQFINWLLSRPHLKPVGAIVFGLASLFIFAGLWLLLIPCFMPLILLALAYGAWELFHPNLCIDVWDAGDRIVFKRGGNSMEVALEQVQSIQFKRSRNPPLAVVQLRTPSLWGSQLTFVPDLRRGREAAKAAIDSLNQRIGGTPMNIESAKRT
jgi:hypothetical protein